jgi:hypothetical protein
MHKRLLSRSPLTFKELFYNVSLFTFIFNENSNLIGLKGRGSFPNAYTRSNFLYHTRNC